jgi:hypothetical protein
MVFFGGTTLMNQIAVIGSMDVCGRKFTIKDLKLIVELTTTFKNLSRKEIAATICDQLHWLSPNGKLKIISCTRALERFEKLGIILLPKKIERAKVSRRDFKELVKDLPNANFTGDLKDVAPIELRMVTSRSDRDVWNGYIDAHHYIGYKTPFGPHIRYFIVSKKRQDQILGCLLFTPASWALKARDEWIGWCARDRIKQLPLILNNSRFLILPWIDIPHLASHVLSVAAKRIAADWKQLYGFSPVLLETFVDSEKFDGACYKAANWEFVGMSAGTGGRGPSLQHIKSRKSIFVLPLTSTFRTDLRGAMPNNVAKIKSGLDQEFEGVWRDIVEVIQSIAEKYDGKWQKRKRRLDSLLLVLLIIRLTLSKNHQGYATTINTFFHRCVKANASLPTPKSLSGAAFCKARMKLDEQIFKDMNSGAIEKYQAIDRDDDWFGHRIFAVDGSKINLPRDLKSQGFTVSSGGHYPQGLCSALYRLKTKIPVDFDLVAHHDERKCAEAHLDYLCANDVVVYDRGYLSYRMLYEHTRRGIHSVFRLQANSFPVINEFMKSGNSDQIVSIIPADSSKNDLRTNYPDMEISPIQFRLVRYEYESTVYFVGTTVLSSEITIQDISDLYHSRWSIEELYKVSKSLIGVEEFHSKTVRGVRQEIFAHFFAVTLSRLLANHGEDNLNTKTREIRRLRRDAKRTSEQLKNARTQVNFKNCLLSFERNLAPLFLSAGEQLSEALHKTLSDVQMIFSRTRSGRSFTRVSYRPDPRWRPDAKNALSKTVGATSEVVSTDAIAACA